MTLGELWVAKSRGIFFNESGSAEAQEKQGVGLPEWEVVVLRRTATTGFSYIKIIVWGRKTWRLHFVVWTRASLQGLPVNTIVNLTWCFEQLTWAFIQWSASHHCGILRIFTRKTCEHMRCTERFLSQHGWSILSEIWLKRNAGWLGQTSPAFLWFVFQPNDSVRKAVRLWKKHLAISSFFLRSWYS